MTINKAAPVLLPAFIVLFAVSAMCQSQAIVTTVDAKLRTAPDGKAAIVKSLPKGVPLEVSNLLLDEDWTSVSSDGKSGWVRRKKIRILMDDPYSNSTWLFMGRSPKTEGFIITFYLNTTQIIRKGDNIRFWTRMVPDNPAAYFKYVMSRAPKKKPSEFKFNVDLWEGDCSSEDIDLLRSLFYWKSSEITRPGIAEGEVDTSSNSAARAILVEACRVAERMGQ